MKGLSPCGNAERWDGFVGPTSCFARVFIPAESRKARSIVAHSSSQDFCWHWMNRDVVAMQGTRRWSFPPLPSMGVDTAGQGQINQMNEAERNVT